MSFRDAAEPWGLCQRSGKRVRLSKLVRDGQYPNMLVDPAWYEPRHPQEIPARTYEDISVRNPSPDTYSDQNTVVVTFPLYDVADGQMHGTAVVAVFVNSYLATAQGVESPMLVVNTTTGVYQLMLSNGFPLGVIP